MQKNKNISIYILILFSFASHLISINFHPTNFEGGYGAFANIFNYEDKILFLTAYFNTQLNKNKKAIPGGNTFSIRTCHNAEDPASVSTEGGRQ